ncbi:hypothetical protein HY502_00100 [Candidatus Woesebacteria bacterium]|nr:hypothetical protein [Candidatus Woesebacteria bacterium]
MLSSKEVMEWELTRTILRKELTGRQIALMLFDVDGVLTNERAVPNTRLLDTLADQLNHSQKMALVTGRSIAWLERNILNYLDLRVYKKSKKNLVAVGEHGAAHLFYNPQGEKVVGIESMFSIPKEIVKDAKNLAESEEFGEFVFFDHEKETMVSLEARHDNVIDQEKVKEALANISQILKSKITGGGENKYKIEASTYAVDIMDASLGKDLATKQAISWFLSLDKLAPQDGLVLAFGDNQRDVEIGRQARKMGYQVYYFNVGEPFKMKERESWRFFQLPRQYSQGTQQVLSHLT